jgi:hypothetical protein
LHYKLSFIGEVLYTEKVKYLPMKLYKKLTF